MLEKNTSRKVDVAANQRRALFLSNVVAVYGLLVVLLLVVVGFGLLRPATFLSSFNINAILIGQSITALLALAEMIPLSTGHFDLSVGYHVGMAQVLIVGMQVEQGLSWPVAALIVLILSMIIGLFNGILITKFKINSFIATMGTGSLLYGVSNWYTNGQQIPGMKLPESFTDLTGVYYGIPLPAVYVGLVVIVLWLVAERMSTGRNLYVIGANVRAAELTGINVDRHVIGAFVASGLICGLAGIMLGSILQTGTPSVGQEYLLPAFAGALLGATSIRPGRVNVIGTLIAVLVVAFAFSGVQQFGAPFYVQYFFNGGILIVAVGLSVYAARQRQRQATSTAREP